MKVLIKKIMNTLALASVFAYFIEVGTGSAGAIGWLTFERIVALLFTAELVWQLKVEDKYWKTSEFIIDLISILPFYIGFFVDEEHLEIVRTFRVFRLLKLFWHNDSFAVMKDAIKIAWPSIKNVGFVLSCLALFCSAILFQIEKETFGTIGNALYFTLTTITTIGFGDFSPKTGLGKAVTIVLLYGPALMVCGSLIGVVCSSYQTSLEKFNKQKRNKHYEPDSIN